MINQKKKKKKKKDAIVSILRFISRKKNKFHAQLNYA